MEVFNKLYSSVSNTVTSTVSQLSSLLGNPITKEYEVGEHIASAGPGLSWKIYKGTKRTTKQNVAVFVFDKNQLKFTKDDRDTILDILRRGVQQLTKIRHPRILTVQHPLEESRDSLAFVTEPIYGSLANILGNHTNLPSAADSNTASHFHQMHEIEIKYGLIQLIEGLQFLHNDMKMIHRNICPESVVVNAEGGWKLFGFDYCFVLNTDVNTGQVAEFCQLPYIPSYRNNLLQPVLDYAAPEWIVETRQVCASDIFSLGVLVYTIHSPNKKPLKLFGTNMESFKSFATDLKLGKYPNLSCIPDGIVDNVRLMLHFDPETRPNLYELPKIQYFDDFGVKALSYLESLYQWDNLQKSKFFKGLPQILEKFPERVNRKQILPCLVREFVNATMIPFVLPNVLQIVQNCPTQAEYQNDIQPHLLPIMKIEQPIQILLIFMQNIELLIKLSTPHVIKNDLLALCNRSLECNMKEIQELCLAVLPLMATHIEYATLKNGVFPRIKKLCISSQHVSIKVNCLISVGKLLEFFDKWFALDDIIPFLTQIPSRDPAVLMAVIGIFKLIMTHKKLGLTKDIMATRVIPFLVPLSIENGLSLSQFNAIMTMVKEIINCIETEHRAKLEQLNSVRQDIKSVDPATSSSFPEFNIDDFKSSCLNSSATSATSTSAGKTSTKVNQVLMPSSTSMPTITPPKTTSSNQVKQLPVLASNTVPPSMSFPSQLQQQQQQKHSQQHIQSNLSLNSNKTISTNLATNLMMNGTSRFSNQSSITSPTNVSMNEMIKSPQNSFASFPAQSPGLMNINSNLSMLSLGSATTTTSNNQQKNGKSVTLSAQEINDFLS